VKNTIKDKQQNTRLRSISSTKKEKRKIDDQNSDIVNLEEGIPEGKKTHSIKKEKRKIQDEDSDKEPTYSETKLNC